jgi:hypothetical protein
MSKAKKDSQKAPTGSNPPVTHKHAGDYICIYPAKPIPAAAKPAAAAAKTEPTLEQKIADEVARRVNAEVGKLALGFLIGEFLSSLWHKHHRD